MDEILPICIIQALPATIHGGKGTPTRPEGSTSSKDEEAWSPNKRKSAIAATRSSLSTRSKAALGWSRREMLVLVSEVAAADSDWQLRSSISSFQRWRTISGGCADAGAPRPSAQCRDKWKELVSGFRRIEDWNANAGGKGSSSYWLLSGERRKKEKLPAEFDREVFDAMTAAMAAQEEPEPASRDSDSDGFIDTHENLPAIAEATQMIVARCSNDENDEEAGDAEEMASRLRERAELIHAILREEEDEEEEEKEEEEGDVKEEEKAAAELAGRRAFRLIDALDGLAGTLDWFAELIKAGGGDAAVVGLRPPEEEEGGGAKARVPNKRGSGKKKKKMQHK